jgi:MFS family permease
MVLGGGFMTLLDVSIVNVALPSIQSVLGATASEIQWIVAGYSLTFGLMLVPAGRFGDVFGRRRMFLIGLAGFTLVSLAARLLPPPRPADPAGGRRPLGLDVPGLLLIAVIVVAFMWPFVTGSSHADGLAGSQWWLIAVAAVLAAALVWWERRLNRAARPAVLPTALVRNTGFVMGAALAAAYFAGFTSIFIVMTMFYQDGLGTSALVAGLAQMPFAIASAVASRWSGRRVTRAGRGIVVQGLAIMLGSVVAIIAVAALVPAHVAQWVIPVLFGVAGWGSGAVISPNQTLTLADVPTPLAGTAAGLLQTFQRLGGSIGLALLTTVYFARVGAGGDGVESYAHALALSLALNVAILAVALGIAVADARRRSTAS